MFIKKGNFKKLILTYVSLTILVVAFLMFFLGRGDNFPKDLLEVDFTKKQYGSHEIYKQQDDKRYFAMHSPSTSISVLNQYIENQKNELQSRFEADETIDSIMVDYQSFQHGDCVSVQFLIKTVFNNQTTEQSTYGFSVSIAEDKIYDMANIVANKGLRVISHEVRKQLPAYNKDNRMAYLRRTNPEVGSFDEFVINEDAFIFYVQNPSGTSETVSINKDRILPYFEVELGNLVKSEGTASESFYLETGADPAKKMVAFTFDDGPNPKNDDRIIEILNKYNGCATFFMLGLELEKHPEMVTKLVDQGHQLGNHSYNHVKFNGLSDSDFNYQMSSVETLIRSQMDYDYPIMFRPPYGYVDKHELARYAMPIVMWNVDSNDWRHKDAPSKTVKEVADTVKDRSIILLHDIHDSTIDAFEVLAQTLNDQGYQFVSVDELLRANNIAVNSGEVYYNGS